MTLRQVCDTRCALTRSLEGSRERMGSSSSGSPRMVWVAVAVVQDGGAFSSDF